MKITFFQVIKIEVEISKPFSFKQIVIFISVVLVFALLMAIILKSGCGLTNIKGKSFEKMTVLLSLFSGQKYITLKFSYMKSDVA